MTSGQSNLTTGRIAAAHGRFSRTRQVPLVCTSNMWFLGHQILNPNGHATRSVTKGRIYVRSTAMRPNSNKATVDSRRRPMCATHC